MIMATRKVHAKYQEIIDLNTVDNTVSVIGIHTPTGDTPRRMFPGFFQQYRKWKYHGCSLTAVNPAQLPLDPLSIGYDAGEGNDAVMDQRDALNPVLFHGCHGEDLGAILNSLYANAESPAVYQFTDSIDGFNEDGSSDSDGGRKNLLEGLYYKSLTDCTWKKFNPQAGLRLKGLHPLVYQVATNHPMYPSSLGGNMDLDGDEGVVPQIDGFFRTGANDFHFITPKLQRLGWMDTRVPYVDASVLSEFPNESLDYNGWVDRMKAIENWAELEKLFMGVILLPPSYRYKQFFRFVITHYFSFAGFRGASLLPDPLGAPSMFHGEYNTIGEPIESQDTDIGGPYSGSGGGGSSGQPVTTLEHVYITVVNNKSNAISVNPTLHFGATNIQKGSSYTSINSGASATFDFGTAYLPTSIESGTQIYATVGDPVSGTSETKVVQVGDVSKTLTILVNPNTSKGESWYVESKE